MPGGGYRYYRDPELGPEYEAAMDALFDTYSDGAAARARVGRRDLPARRRASPTPRAAARSTPRRSTCCAACCPPPRSSHMGIYATGQAYEQLILHLLGHPLPEARHYGELILDAIKAVMPSFVARVERPERGGEWVALPRARGARPASAGPRGSGLDRDDSAEDAPVGARCCTSTATRTQLLAALLFEAAGVERGAHARRGRARSRADERARAARRPRRRARATAATAPAAASRRCATASRSSPTTARSATSSATAC